MDKKYDSDSKKIPVVLPILVYHGENEWKIENNLKCLITDYDKLPKEFLKYIPNFDFELYDLSLESKKIIKGNCLTKAITEILKAIKIKDLKKFIIAYMKMIDLIKEHEKFDYEEAIRIFEIIVNYILSVRNDVDDRQLAEIDTEHGGVIMSIAEKLIKQGEQRGEKRGEKRGEQRGIKRGAYDKAIETAKKALAQGANIKFISEITDLPTEKIEELKKEMKK